MAASSSVFGYWNAGARLKRIGAPFLLTARSPLLAENFRSAGDVLFAMFMAARVVLRLTGAALLLRSRLGSFLLFMRRDMFRSPSSPRGVPLFPPCPPA